ncbi:MAG: alpha/beta fold hydrolase [Cyclobacteriaceae bacterium]|nr:alpha/beta fold hydrolase [Cyclobacteriaceae bacterium]UYN87177.1 MAG: alpha/beta fold hydrolase [Cyclobacteriaceae bacterium]
MNPVLLLHGALGASTQLEPLKHKLEASGRTVYVINFSGHGGEPFRKSFGIEIFADDVLVFLRKHNLNQVDVFGYSLGGYVAVWLALMHSKRIGKIVTLGTKFDWSVESAEKEVRKLNADKILEKVPAFARVLEHRHAPNDWKELLNNTAEMMMGLGGNPLLTEENLKSIQQPVVVCLGDEDDMADRSFAEQVARWLPNGKFHLLENTPHPIEKVDLDKLIGRAGF